MTFINSFQSEWIKKRRSAASWLTLVGGCIIPAIITCVRFIQHTKTLQGNSSDGIWYSLFNQSWQFMAIILLPMGVILAASLITQIEYRNNGWKQLHTTPQSLTVIFWAKLSVVVIMLVQFFLLLNIGIYIAGVLPALVFTDIPFPQQDFPFFYFLKGNARFFLNCLPILAFQYLLSLHIKNFMVPIGIGIVMEIVSMIALSWEYGYILPYSYCSLQYLANDSKIDPTVNLHVWAAGYFLFFTLVNYLFYLSKIKKLGLTVLLKSNPKKMITSFSAIGLLIIVVVVSQKKGNTNVSQNTENVTQRIKQIEENTGFVKFKIKGRPTTTIEERMKYYEIKGLSIAVINNYKVEYAKGYGWADAEEKKAVTTETLFQPGSISKSINALGIAKLYQEKKVDLFKNINTYLTSWKFPYDSISKGKKITLAQLLSHSAGLNVHGFGFTTYSGGDTLPSIVQMLEGKKPSTTEAIRSLSEPGMKYKYSGGGTIISQLLLMDVTKQSYENYMLNNVLVPLNMKNSSFSQPPIVRKGMQLATGYTQMNNGGAVKGKYPITPQQAAAGIWTTPTDLANMIINIQQSLKGKPGAFLSKNVAELMLLPYNDKSAALGFFIDDKNGTKYFQHGAGNPGFSGWYYASMKGGKGVVILANSDANSEIFGEVIKAVADAFGWHGFAKPERPSEKVVFILSDSVMNRLEGTYRQNNSVIVVQRKRNTLWFKTQEKSWEMHFTSDTSFFNLESNSEKRFYRDIQGRIAGITYKNEIGTQIRAIKISPITPPETLLQKYKGQYLELGGETATLLVKDNYLWIQSENAIALMKFHFLNNTDFYLEENGGIFSFELNNNGSVNGVVVRSGEIDKMILTRMK